MTVADATSVLQSIALLLTVRLLCRLNHAIFEMRTLMLRNLAAGPAGESNLSSSTVDVPGSTAHIEVPEGA